MGAITEGIDSLQKCECKQIQNIFLFWYQMKLFTSVPLVISYLTRLSFHLHKLLDLRLKEEWMMPFFTPKRINQFQFRLIILKKPKGNWKTKKKREEIIHNNKNSRTSKEQFLGRRDLTISSTVRPTGDIGPKKRMKNSHDIGPNREQGSVWA